MAGFAPQSIIGIKISPTIGAAIVELGSGIRLLQFRNYAIVCGQGFQRLVQDCSDKIDFGEIGYPGYFAGSEDLGTIDKILALVRGEKQPPVLAPATLPRGDS